ncbi:MAG: prenyltransferase/squalene oxidase repeat-containing protein, partial [Planctomycetota bacterium]
MGTQMIRRSFLILLGAAILPWGAGNLRAGEEAFPRKAIEKGLDYLVKTQETSGCWTVIDRGCRPSDGARVGLTALGVLSLLAQGSTPTEGKYSEPLKKGLAYLLSAARDDGAILDARGPNHLGKPVKNWYVDLQTGLGVIALAECYGKVKDKKTRETIQGKVEAAIRYLQKIQLKTGGWDYRESSDGGPYGITHVTVSDTYTVLAAFLAARDA